MSDFYRALSEIFSMTAPGQMRHDLEGDDIQAVVEDRTNLASLGWKTLPTTGFVRTVDTAKVPGRRVVGEVHRPRFRKLSDPEETKMGGRLYRVLSTLGALLLWMPIPATCGLLGSSVIGTPYFPVIGSIGGTGHGAGPIVVQDPAMEFPEGLILYSGHIDITDHQILWIPTTSTTYLTSPFNGFELDFLGAPPITSVKVNPSSALNATSIVFTTDKVLVNFSGKTVVSGVPAVFDVNPVPEPATMALFGIGLAGLASTLRRRN